MTSLKQKAVSGIKWSAFSQVGRQAMQLLTTVILTRFLTPSDFGLVGMAMVVVGFVNIFKDLGTAAAVIQRKELPGTLLSSIFWVNTGFGTLAMFCLLITAPIAGWFYRDSRVVPVLQILSTSFLISSFGTLQQALLERKLAFNTLAKLEVVSVLSGSITGIGLALGGAGVWSLVFQTLITASVASILLWFSSSWRPEWEFHWNDAKSISRFSLNLTGYSIFNYFARNADYLLIGRYLGAQDLGYYTLAYRILVFPLQNISAVVSRVMYPVLSTMQDDNKRFVLAYLRVVVAIALISFPLMMGLFVLAEPLVLSFFGQAWMPVIPLIRIFAPVGMLQSIGATAGVIYQVKGQTGWMLRWGIFAGTFAVIAIVIGLYWGIVGVAATYAVASLILFYPGLAIPYQLINLKFVHMLVEILPSLLCSSAMFVFLFTFKRILPEQWPDILILIISVITGGVVYFLASWLMNRERLKEVWQLAVLNKAY